MVGVPLCELVGLLRRIRDRLPLRPRVKAVRIDFADDRQRGMRLIPVLEYAQQGI
jgi:hypothetical protein